MAIFGGLTQRSDGRSVLQLFVDAADAVQLIELGGDRYQQYEGTGFKIDLGGNHDIAEVWFSVVPDDGTSHVIRPKGLDQPGNNVVWSHVEPS